MNHDEIIEAGARAEYERERAYMSSNGVGMPPWEDVNPYARKLALAEAGRYLDAMEPLIRAAIAEEIAVAQELAAGERCPQCRGKVASRKWVRGHILSRCGCGNSWDDKSGRFVEYPKIARQIGEQR